MFKYNPRTGEIEITQGETQVLNLTLNGYTMQSGDTLTLTVTDKPNGNVLMKIVSNSTALELTKDKTALLPYGSFCYDIALDTPTMHKTLEGIRNNFAPYKFTVLASAEKRTV